MKFKEIGEVIYIPEINGKPLEGKQNIKFNYYISTRLHKDMIEMNVTTKLFHEDDIYIRQARYRLKMGQIEKCVKRNLIEHMCSLGMKRNDLPKSVLYRDSSSFIRNSRSSRVS